MRPTSTTTVWLMASERTSLSPVEQSSTELIPASRPAEQDRDLDQARLAIEALRALVPVLDGSASDELVRDFRQVTANLQLAYADAAKDAG